MRILYYGVILGLLGLWGCSKNELEEETEWESWPSEEGEEGLAKETICTDGKDNDFDGKIDRQDLDCRVDSNEEGEDPADAREVEIVMPDREGTSGSGRSGGDNRVIIPPTRTGVTVPVTPVQPTPPVGPVGPPPFPPPPPPPPPPLVPIVPLPVDGNGDDGGFDDDIPDDGARRTDDDERHDDDFCGNGKQNARPQSQALCPHYLYGVAIDGSGGASTLFELDHNTGRGIPIGSIGFDDVTAIDFSPDGVLFAVGERTISNVNQNVLLQINCQTGVGVVIGRTNIESISTSPTPFISDITFDAQGFLFGYLVPDGILGFINPVTGAFTSIGPSGLHGTGNALGAAPFPLDEILLADQAQLSALSTSSGAASFISALQFRPPADDNPTITGMDLDARKNILFGALINNPSGPSDYVLVTIKRNGRVDFVEEPPHRSPNGLTGVSVNVPYEECDPGPDDDRDDDLQVGLLQNGMDDGHPLPPGTACSNDCHIVETDCSDGIDNNGNGRTDCADLNCLGMMCNDQNGCTTNDACVGNGTCMGTSVDCTAIVDNQCLISTCQSTGPTTFVCNSVFDSSKTSPGDCDAGDVCELGQCVLGNPVSTSFCMGVPKIDVSTPLGCNDNNSCTADGCLPLTGTCLFSAVDDGDICMTDTNACTIQECDRGVCTQVSVITQCPSNGNPCDLEGTCDPVTGCVPDTTALNGTVCNAADLCTNSTCLDGVCQLASLVSCDDGNDCTLDSCSPGTGCLHTNVPNGTPCDTSDLCVTGTCTAGTCNTVPVTCPQTAIDPSCSLVSCDPDRGCLEQFLVGINCNDSDACTLDDFCSDTGACGGGIAVVCDHDNQCLTNPACNPATGCPAGVFAPGPCNDGNPCTLNDVCAEVDGLASCIGNNAVLIPVADGGCDDGNICTDDFCDEIDGCVHILNNTCGSVVFVTSTHQDGDFGGVTGADAICQGLASTAGLPGTYLAWISDSLGNSPSTRFNQQNRPYIRVDTVQVAADWTDLTSGTLDAAIIIDETGALIDNTSTDEVFTGTNPDGTPNASGTGTYCDNWVNPSAVDTVAGGIANIAITNGEWTLEDFPFNCLNAVSTNRPRLYCFQQ